MADTYSDRLGLIKQEEGTHSNEWGDLLNLNMQRLDAATRGYTKITLAGAETLDSNDISTTSSTAEEESFFAFIEFAGTSGTVTVPAENIVWTVYNNADADFTFQPSGGTGVTLTQGKVHTIVYGSNGTTFTDVTSLMLPGKLEASVDTAAGDNAAMGYTATEGLVLTGQGSTNDVTIKNDADAEVISVLTGTTTVTFAGHADITTAFSLRWGDAGERITGSNASGNLIAYTNDTAALTLDSSQNATCAGNVTATGTINATGDTSAGDNSTLGYTATEGAILTGQGSTNDVTIKNDADATVISIPTGTTTTTFASDINLTGDLTNSGVARPRIYLTSNATNNVQEIWFIDSDATQALLNFDSTNDEFRLRTYSPNGFFNAAQVQLGGDGTFELITGGDNSGVGSVALTVDASQNATFSGSVDIAGAHLALPTSTTTALADITDAINTAATKVEGVVVFNTTTNKPVYAVGAADGDVWVDATGATAHTPS